MTIQSSLEELQERVLEFQALKDLSVAEQQSHAIKKRLEYCAEQIWSLMQADLLDLASQWLRSELGRDRINHGAFDDARRSLALIAFEAIFLRLTAIKIDPEKNLKALLFVIGKRGLYNENKWYLPNAMRPSDVAAETQALASLERGAMWEPHDLGRQAPTSEDLADPKSFDWETRLIESFDMVRYGPAIRTAISQLLAHEQLILSLRYAEPATPYKAIAEMLQMKDAAIRQSCKRALQKINRYLGSVGFVE